MKEPGSSIDFFNTLHTALLLTLLGHPGFKAAIPIIEEAGENEVRLVRFLLRTRSQCAGEVGQQKMLQRRDLGDKLIASTTSQHGPVLLP